MKQFSTKLVVLFGSDNLWTGGPSYLNHLLPGGFTGVLKISVVQVTLGFYKQVVLSVN